MKMFSDAEIKKELKIDDKLLNRFKDIRENSIKEAKSLNKDKKDIIALGISGSARDKNDMAQEDSNSEFLLNVALKELEKLGAKTELIQLRKYDIKPCKACYSTTNTQCHYPCSCYAKETPMADDMTNILYDKLIAADIIIFATPVNNMKVSSHMSLFMDRCISMDGSLSPADPEHTKSVDINVKHTKFVQMNADEKVPGSGFIRRFSGKVAGIIVTGHEAGASLTISSLFMMMNHWGMIFPPWSNVYAMSSLSNPTYKDKSIVENQMFIDDCKELAENVMATAKLVKGYGKQNWKYDYTVN